VTGGLFGFAGLGNFFLGGSEIFERKMPPKKREKEPDTSKNIRMEQIQADHELFLQAFESK
jgi:hypothetical protein